MTTIDGCLSPLTELVGHLRWRIGAPGPDDLVGRELVAAPQELVARGGIHRRRAGQRRPPGARLAVVAGLRLPGGGQRRSPPGPSPAPCPDPAAAGCGVGIARSRPSSLLVDPAAAVVTDLTRLVERIFDGHLDPLADALRADHRLGTQLLWGNVAAGIGSVLGRRRLGGRRPADPPGGGRHPGRPPPRHRGVG